MALTAGEHQTVKRATRQVRNAAGRERRANGIVYRKAPFVVTVLDLRPQRTDRGQLAGAGARAGYLLRGVHAGPAAARAGGVGGGVEAE